MRKYITVLIAAAAAFVLAACGGKKPAETAAAPAESQASESASESPAAASQENTELKEIDVVLDWYPNAVHTFLYEAADKGYFAEEGLKVNIISPAESIDALTFVAAGRAQIGLTYPVDVVMAAANEHMPVKAIGGVVQDELSCMASLSGSGITADMSSLKGKKVGHSGPAVEEAVIRTIIANAGLSEQDVEVINVGFDLTTSLTTGSTDMVVGTFINDEIVTMKNAGYEVDVWKNQDYGVPRMYGLVLAANSKAYDEDPELYKAFLRACKKGFQDMKADEDESLKIIMSEMNSDDNPLDEAQQKESYEILMPLMEEEDRPFLSMQEADWQDIISWMQENSLIEEAPAPSDVYIVPED